MAEDTISAVTTALGEGAVGIVRISGPKALAVGETLFKAASGKALGAYPVNTLAYGHVYDTDGSLVDEVLAVYMRAPRSYTAEDVVESSVTAVCSRCRRFCSLLLLPVRVRQRPASLRSVRF